MLKTPKKETFTRSIKGWHTFPWRSWIRAS